MYFSQLEKRAILTFANAMIAADGRVAADEFISATLWFNTLGFSESDLKLDNLEPSQAMTVISNLSYDEKRCVTSLLITIMIADKEIHPKEKALIDLITSFCNLPEMSAADIQGTLEDLTNNVI